MKRRAETGAVVWLRFYEWCAARPVLLRPGNTLDAVQAIRDRFGVSRATAYRWIAAWDEVVGVTKTPPAPRLALLAQRNTPKSTTTKASMSRTETVDVLSRHQAWRRDIRETDRLEMLDPELVGRAIDSALAYLAPLHAVPSTTRTEGGK